MGTKFPRPTGELQGDDSPIPSRGTRTGQAESYGADLTSDALNRAGSAKVEQDDFNRVMPAKPGSAK